MIITTASATTDQPGPLTRIVLDYCEKIAARATASGSSAADWEPLREIIAVDEFQRVGAYLEVMSWSEYVDFLTEWAGTTRFEATMYRITEVGRSVFQEIEERHWHGEEFIRKNVIAVYRFNDEDKISHLDIYEQARDSGQWIVEAARGAVDG